MILGPNGKEVKKINKRPDCMTNEAIRAIYNSLEVKDLPYEEFARQLTEVLDPDRGVDTLEDIQEFKAAEKRKSKIILGN